MKSRRFGSPVSSSVAAWRSTSRCRRAFSSAMEAWAASDDASARAAGAKPPDSG